MRDPIVVLKFGSSVLRDADDLPRALLEIDRERRRGVRVVAVVSAFGDATDRLLAEARTRHDRPEPAALAIWLETGERRAAAALGLALAEAGVPATVLDAARIGLVTVGDPLDASPAGLDTDALRAALDAAPVAVVPGFAGRDTDGATTLLGRGGSDLTALFLADRLGASCRLLKDVPGLLRVGPRGDLDPSTRYAAARWDECLRVGRPLVQPKAVEFARSRGQAFAISRCGARGGTVVGPGPDRFETIDPAPRPLRVALGGLGAVGLGVLRWARALPEDLEVIAALVRDPGRPRAEVADGVPLVATPEALLDAGPDLVVETVGGRDAARRLVRDAAARGLPVVTANKALLAREPSLAGGAAPVRFSAAVGGAVPMLETAARVAAREPVVAVTGVLNGTANVVLDRLGLGEALDVAVDAARDEGLAEADPSRDLDGRDAADKLSLLCAAAFGRTVPPDAVARDPIDASTRGRAVRARASGKRLRQVAEARREGGRVIARVSLRAVEADAPLGRCDREGNRLRLDTASGRVVEVAGKGAGRWPTALSVLSDVMDLRRRLDAETVRPAAERRA